MSGNKIKSQPHLQSSSVGRMVVERSENVLWSLSPKGIVLHNLVSGGYIELDQDGYRTWAFLDGARAVEDVVVRCAEPDSDRNRSKRRKILRIIDKLVEHGFAEEAQHDRA